MGRVLARWHIFWLVTGFDVVEGEEGGGHTGGSVGVSLGLTSFVWN